MAKIKLTASKVSDLISQKHIYIDDKSVLQVHDDEVVLIRNGNVYNIVSVSIELKKREIEYEQIIKFLQRTICKHFNLGLNEVIYSSGAGNEVDFILRLNPNVEWKIVVVTYNQALANARHFFDEPFQNTKEQIGPYKRLGKSAYYFRWVEKI